MTAMVRYKCQLLQRSSRSTSQRYCIQQKDRSMTFNSNIIMTKEVILNHLKSKMRTFEVTINEMHYAHDNDTPSDDPVKLEQLPTSFPTAYELILLKIRFRPSTSTSMICLLTKSTNVVTWRSLQEFEKRTHLIENSENEHSAAPTDKKSGNTVLSFSRLCCTAQKPGSFETKAHQDQNSDKSSALVWKTIWLTTKSLRDQNP
ncbi:hypothetical protein ACOME3_000324 [Neoechinorhynchus agilis]